MSGETLVNQHGEPIAIVTTDKGMFYEVLGPAIPEEEWGAVLQVGPDGKANPAGDFPVKHPNSGKAGKAPEPPASVKPIDNGTLGRIYTMPMPSPEAPADEQTEAQEESETDPRPWYERAWDEASRVASETLEGWGESLQTAWDALPGTADAATTEAARQRIADGVSGAIEGLGTLMGPPPEFIEYAYRSGDAQAIAVVEQMQQNQREAIGAIGDATKESWDAAHARNGTAGAVAMVLATLGMEAVGGKGMGAVLRTAEKVADIVRLAKTPLEAANKLDEAIKAAKAAGDSAEEIAVLEKARDRMLAQSRRDAAKGKDGVAVRKGRLAPNSTYEINGYKYTTDEQGRIKTVEGELRTDSAPRSEHAQRNVGVDDGRLSNDQGGHLIGAQFGGYGSYENLTPMASQINAYPNGKWGQMEQGWAEHLKAGDTVHVKIELNYPDDTIRAGSFRVTETVNGIPKPRTIVNP